MLSAQQDSGLPFLTQLLVGGEDNLQGVCYLGFRGKADGGAELADLGYAAAHVFEAGAVGLAIGDELNSGAAFGEPADQFGQVVDADLAGLTYVENLAPGGRGLDQAKQAAN